MASLTLRALPADEAEEIISVLDPVSKEAVMQARKIWDAR